MAGILATSVSVSMVSGDTAVDNNFGGYLTAEAVALSLFPAATAAVWTLAKPAGSTTRGSLASSSGIANGFTPDVAGFYVLQAVVDGSTTYILRLSVTQVAVTTSLEAIRYQPKADSEVVTPALGVAMFFSTTATPDRLRIKATDDSVADVATASGGGVVARTVTIAVADLTASATSQAINISTALPANAQVLGVSIPLTTPFTGGGATSATVDIGSSGDPNAITAAADVFAAAVDGEASSLPAGISPNKFFSSSTQLTATVTSDVNVDTLVAGSMSVRVMFVVL